MHTVILRTIIFEKVQGSEILSYINKIIPFVDLFAALHVKIFFYHYHTMHMHVSYGGEEYKLNVKSNVSLLCIT